MSLELLSVAIAALTFITGILGKIMASYSGRLKTAEAEIVALKVDNATLKAQSSGQTAMLGELKAEVSDIRDNMVRRDDLTAMAQLIADSVRSKGQK